MPDEGLGTEPRWGAARVHSGPPAFFSGSSPPAGFELSDIVRLNYYTTDVDRFFEEYDVLTARLAEFGCRPAATLLGVTRLAFPELLVEIEATAVT